MPNELSNKPSQDSQADNAETEYRLLSHYEIELFKSRWLVFIVLLSVSFVITGLGLQQIAAKGPLLPLRLICILGAIVYFVGLFHYWWFHNKTCALRTRLIELEKIMGFRIHRAFQESKPTFLSLKPKFYWLTCSLTLLYLALLIYILVM
jgi:hypothetical protein